jgi:hypothetical protein
MTRLHTFLKIFSQSLIGTILLIFISTSLITHTQTSGVENVQPGETKTFKITYSNLGGNSTMQKALLTVFLGDELVLDESSITDTFAGGETYAVDSNEVVTQNAGNWGTQIEYRPRSAQDSNNPSGKSTPGTAEIPTGKEGILKFEAKLKEDVLDRYNVGDKLLQENNQGVLSVFEYSGTESQQEATSIKIEKPDPSNLAKEDVGNKNGGFDGKQRQLIYDELLLDPNPVTMGQDLNVTVTGLLDSATEEPLNNTDCTVFMQGPNNFDESYTGTVTSGQCEVTIDDEAGPTVIGNYEVVGMAMGENGKLYTQPQTVEYQAAEQEETVDTGGTSFNLWLTGTSLLGISLAAIYLTFSRRHRLKLDR